MTSPGLPHGTELIPGSFLELTVHSGTLQSLSLGELADQICGLLGHLCLQGVVEQIELHELAPGESPEESQALELPH